MLIRGVIFETLYLKALLDLSWQKNTDNTSKLKVCNTDNVKLYRSSRSEVLCKNGVLKFFLQNSLENPCVGVCFFIKITGLRAAKKRLEHSCFPLNFAKFLIFF